MEEIFRTLLRSEKTNMRHKSDRCLVTEIEVLETFKVVKCNVSYEEGTRFGVTKSEPNNFNEGQRDGYGNREIKQEKWYRLYSFGNFVLVWSRHESWRH